MQTTFSIFTDIKQFCEQKKWDSVISLCLQLKNEERLMTEDLLYAQEYISLYAAFAKNGFIYSDDLHYADNLTCSAHVSYTYPRLRFLCNYIMLCGLKQGAEKIYLNENDYLHNMLEASFGMKVDFDSVMEDESLFNQTLFPSFEFLKTLESLQYPDAIPINVEGFIVECGVLVRYTGKDSVVVVPDGVKAIGDGAFANTSQPVEEVTLPEGLDAIGCFAFHDAQHNKFGFCSNHLKKVITPSTLKRIGEGAFMQCHKLEEIDISMVEVLEDDVFKWSTSLKCVDLSSLKTIGSNVFWSCFRIEEIKNYHVGRESIPTQSFRSCGKLQAFEIPENVTIVESLAFSDCGSITELDISRIERMGTYTFSHCEMLKKVEFSPKLKEIPYKAFYGCADLEDIQLPCGLETLGSGAFGGCVSAKNVNIPDSVKSIGSECFLNCKTIRDVSIPENINVIAENTFLNCVSLQSIKLPETLIAISDGAFEECVALNNFVMPQSVEILGKNAFKNCRELTCLDLSNVKTLGANCFTGCKNLQTVKVRSDADIHPKAFSGIRKLKIEFID